MVQLQQHNYLDTTTLNNKLTVNSSADIHENLNIFGNLNVTGNTNQINSEQINVLDKNMF